MLGASTAGFFTPFALGYALHAGRGEGRGVAGRVALAAAAVEALTVLVLAGGWLWNRIG